MNICKNVQGKIVAGERLTRGEREHVAVCGRCGQIETLNERFAAAADACREEQPRFDAVNPATIASKKPSRPLLVRHAWLAAGLAAAAIVVFAMLGRITAGDSEETATAYEIMEKIELYQQKLWEADEDTGFESLLFADTSDSGLWYNEDSDDEDRRLPESIAVFELWLGERPF